MLKKIASTPELHPQPPTDPQHKWTCLKKALLVGVNYVGTDHKLKGSINDVMRMKDCLVKVYGFSEKDITILIDKDRSDTQPTGENIRQVLSLLVGSAKPRDILFLYFSGHGRRKRSKNKDDDTGYDESIVAVDDELMIDDYFKELVDKVPQGCILTILSDSCHSGGLIEGAKEQIGDSTKKKWLNSRGISELDNLPPVGYSYVGVKSQKEDACLEREEIVKGSPPDCGILLSACQSNEKAWEASFTQNPDEVYGVFTNAILDIIKELHGQVTNRELVEKATKKLMEQRFNQTPGLYCSDDHADAYFLSGVRNN